MAVTLPIFQPGFRLVDGTDLNAMVAAIQLLQFPGQVFYVNESTGNDTKNTGLTASAPFATLSHALSLCISGQNDVVFFTGTIHTTATLTWNKDKTHLIGLSAQSDNDRARISSSGSSVFTPFVNVTGQGCIFANFATFYGYNDASTQICWAEAGGRNNYVNVQLLGGGNATAAAQAGMRSLTIAGSGENLFEGCTIGLNTVARATNANASLEFLSGTARNVFRSCIFQMYSSLSGNVHVKAGATSMDREQLFVDCTFLNSTSSAATSITAAFSINASAGGACVLQRCTSFGAGKISASGPVYVDGGPPTAGTTGLAVAAS